jgi:hypothetical protein
VVPSPAPDTAFVAIQAESDFYEPLSPYGEWVVVGTYGRCWRPLRVGVAWRPYCNGYWQRTDAGWYWVTDEPWGWATYHYGRWDWTVNFGWVWVPRTQWAPSWVAWREGEGYVGWAPLPPTATISLSGGVMFRDPAYAPRAFVFVEERRLLEPVRPASVIVNNTTVINKTVNITKIQVVNKTVVNEGPRPEVVQRATGRRIQTVQFRDLRRKEEAPVINRRQINQRNAAATVEHKAPAPARTEPQPAKEVRAHPEPQMDSTGQATKPAAAPVARNDTRDVQAGKRSAAPTETGRELQPLKEQNKPAVAPVVTRSEPAARPAAAVAREPERVKEQLRSPKEHAASQDADRGAELRGLKKQGGGSEAEQKRGALNWPQ